jgi:glutathione S-transferase
MDYCVATIHMQGFQRIFRPGNYSSNTEEHDAIKARGRQIFEAGYGLMDEALDGKDYVVGEFSVADAALFYVEFWGAARLKVSLPPRLAAHYARMCARPAVAAVLKKEGFA